MKNLMNKVRLITGVLFMMLTIVIFSIDYTLHDVFVTFVLLSVALASAFIGIFLIVPAAKNIDLFKEEDDEPMKGTDSDPRIKKHTDDIEAIRKYLDVMAKSINNNTTSINAITNKIAKAEHNAEALTSNPDIISNKLR